MLVKFKKAGKLRYLISPQQMLNRISPIGLQLQIYYIFIVESIMLHKTSAFDKTHLRLKSALIKTRIAMIVFMILFILWNLK